MKSILKYLYENSKPWRPRSEIYVIKDKKLIVGYVKNNNWEGYIIPGGGIDYGETPEKAAARECAEEIGIKVKDLKLLKVKQIAYHEDSTANVPNAKKYSSQYSGIIILTFIGLFESQIKKIEKAEFEIREITIDEAVRFFTKNTKSLEKSPDKYNYDKSKYVLETLNKIKKEIMDV